VCVLACVRERAVSVYISVCVCMCARLFNSVVFVRLN